MKKILLYNPKENTRVRVPHVPFSLLTLASELNERYEVIIIDGRLLSNPEKEIERHINNCMFFGITSMSGTPILNALRIAAFVRSLNAAIPIVWGGFHPTMVLETTINHPLVDIVVLGQGEVTVVELAEAIYKNETLELIKGIAYKKNGEIVINEAREIKDINAFRRLEYSLVNVEKYIKNDANDRTLDYLSSRGCPHQCSFCSINNIYKRKYYPYKSERVIDEIEDLVKTYNINGIRFMDDNFFVDRKRVQSICDGIISRKLNLKWWAMCRVDEIVGFDESYWAKLKKAGLTILNVGVESGSQKILDKISKNITCKMILEASRICGEHEVESQFSFMAGFPFETEADLRETVLMINKINEINRNIDIGLFIYAPNPGTPLFAESVVQGFKGYSSLEEWGEKCDYFQGTVPWLSGKKRKKLELLSYMVQFAFGATLQRKLKLFPKLIHKLFSIDAKLRWKFNILQYPVEWLLLRYLVGGYSGFNENNSETK